MYSWMQNLHARKKIHSLMMLFYIFVMLLPSSAWAGPATDSLRKTINQVIGFLNDPKLKTPDKIVERRKIVQKLLEEKVDEQEISRRALGAHWRGRTDEEKREFSRLFSDLLENTYFDKLDGYVVKMDNFSEGSILYLKEKAAKKYTIVETKVVVNKETEVSVSYLLKNSLEKWLVCDIAIEGVSLLKNYRVQFNEIIANSSFEELLAKLRSKKISRQHTATAQDS